MKFTYKTAEELSKLTVEQQDYYLTQKRTHETGERKNEMLALLKTFFGLDKTTDAEGKEVENKEEVTFEMVTAKMVSLGISKAEFNEVKETINQLKEGQPSTTTSNVAKFVKQFKTQKAALIKAVKGDGPEVELKADTLRANISDNPYQLLLPDIGQLLRLSRGLYDRCKKIVMGKANDNGVVRYVDWDEDTTVKAAAARAEGAAFPQSTAKFKTYSLEIRKIGDTLPVSEEFFEDEETAAGELEAFLSLNVEAAVDDQLVNGNNAGENLKGLLASVDAYVPVPFAVPDANLYDLIVLIKSAITKPGGKKYRPNIAVMNEDLVNLLVLKKDANNNYIFPPNHPIYAMICVDNNMPANTMVVGDDRYMRIYEKAGVMISKGVVNAQFAEDMMLLKARTRLGFLIRNSDKSGFRKIEAVPAALGITEQVPA